MKKRATRGPRVTKKCEYCSALYTCKKSAAVHSRFCSRQCYADSQRTLPRPDPRPCEVCGTLFKPSRKMGHARFCSKSCIWRATKGPEFNARIARETVDARAAKQRGTGTKWYIKLYGRHEHRVVAEQMLGRPLRRGEVVHHIDENKHNNDPGNLMITTQRQHMLEHGLGIAGAVGEAAPRSKLCNADVFSIRAMWLAGKKYEFIANAFDLSAKHVAAIIARRVWAHI